MQVSKEELEKELNELEKKNEKADGWGAAVGARHERIQGIKASLAAMARNKKPDSD